MGLLGYYAGGALGPLLDGVRRYEEGIALVLVVGVAVWLGVRHARRAVRWRELRLSDVLALFHAVVPFVIGLMGVLNLLSAIWPREPQAVLELQEWLPLEVMQRSRPLMLLAGVALLQVTRNLARRKALAWWVAVIALSVSLLSHAGRAFDLHHSMVAALLLSYLFVYRRRFSALSDPASLRQAFVMAPVLAVVVWVFGVVGLVDLREQFRWDPGNGPALEAVRSGLLTIDPGVDPLTAHAALFLGSLQIAGWASRFYVLVLRAAAGRPAPAAGGAAGGGRARGDGSTAAARCRPSRPTRTSTTCSSPTAAASSPSRCAAASPSPPATPSARPPTCPARPPTSSRTAAGTAGRRASTRSRAASFRPTGGWACASLKIAEEALIELPAFSLAGGKRAALRSMVHKVTRMGLEVRRYDRDALPDAAVDEQLEAISEEWLAEKPLGEMGFTVSRFSLEALCGVFVFLCLQDERVVAFTSWRPYRGGRAAVLDLMRKRADAPSGTMDLLVSRSLEELRSAGLEEASLANAPLANVGTPRGGLERGVALLFENLNAFYGYKNLFQFKKKFAPRWEGRHLVYPGGPALPAVAYALTGVHGGGGLRQLTGRR